MKVAYLYRHLATRLKKNKILWPLATGLWLPGLNQKPWSGIRPTGTELFLAAHHWSAQLMEQVYSICWCARNCCWSCTWLHRHIPWGFHFPGSSSASKMKWRSGMNHVVRPDHWKGQCNQWCSSTRVDGCTPKNQPTKNWDDGIPQVSNSPGFETPNNWPTKNTFSCFQTTHQPSGRPAIVVSGFKDGVSEIDEEQFSALVGEFFPRGPDTETFSPQYVVAGVAWRKWLSKTWLKGPKRKRKLEIDGGLIMCFSSICFTNACCVFMMSGNSTVSGVLWLDGPWGSTQHEGDMASQEDLFQLTRWSFDVPNKILVYATLFSWPDHLFTICVAMYFKLSSFPGVVA